MSPYAKEGTFQLGEITKAAEGPLDVFMETYVSREKERGRLIETYMLRVERYKNEAETYGQGKYKVKVYHMEDDEFRGKVYPQSFVDFCRYKWFNRKHFRIL